MIAKADIARLKITLDDVEPLSCGVSSCASTSVSIACTP